jgi:hypothetical protein
MAYFGRLLYNFYQLKFNFGCTSGRVISNDQDANGNRTVNYIYTVNGSRYQGNEYADHRYPYAIGGYYSVRYSLRHPQISSMDFDPENDCLE